MEPDASERVCAARAPLIGDVAFLLKTYLKSVQN
jgi:hypothetical protein